MGSNPHSNSNRPERIKKLSLLKGKLYFLVLVPQILKAMKNQMGPLEIENFFAMGGLQRGLEGVSSLPYKALFQFT